MTTLASALAVAALIGCGVPASAIVRFGLLAMIGFYLPGSLLAPSGVRRHEAIAVASALGLALAMILWGGAMWLGMPPQAPFAALLLLAVIAVLRGSWRLAPRSSRGLALVLLACGSSVAWTQFGDARVTPGGGIRFTGTYASEALFHCAIAQDLRHDFPLEFPAGVTLPYHVAYNVLAALTTEATGASLLDVNYRLLPLFLVPLAGLSAVAFAEAIGATPAAALAGAVFLFFADDLSWIVAATGAARSPGRAWSLLFGAPLLYALHHNRGFLLGVGLLFPALILVGRYLRRGEARDLTAGALLMLVLFECKVTFLATVLPAIAVVGALGGISGSRVALAARSAFAVLVSALLVLPLALPMMSAGRGGYAALAWAPGEAGILPLIRLGAVAGDPVHGVPLDQVGLPYLLGGLSILILGSLGIRGLGLLVLTRGFRRKEMIAELAAATVACGGLIVALLVTPPARVNTVYFWGVSLALLAVLSGIAAFSIVTRGPPTRRVAAAVVIGVLALPGALQFLWVERSVHARAVLKARDGTEEIVRWLDHHARPGDVLLEPPAEASFLAALVPVKPVIAWPEWIENTLGAGPVRERLDDERSFFSTTDQTLREAILERYEVSWVWVPRRFDCPPLSRLSLVAESGAGRLYAVLRPALAREPRSESYPGHSWMASITVR